MRCRDLICIDSALDGIQDSGGLLLGHQYNRKNYNCHLFDFLALICLQ